MTAEVADGDLLRLDLPAEATGRLRAAFAGLPAEPVDGDVRLARLLGAAALLPTGILARLLAFRSSPWAPAAVLLTGLPVDDDLPPTPTGERPDEGKPPGVSEAAILMVAVLLGEPVAYRAEKDGALVQDVYPTRASARTPSNESSAASLGFHTELTFSRTAPDRAPYLGNPDFVLLLGLRCPPERAASTAVVDARAVCARLTPAQRATLRRPAFRLRAPYSFTRDGDGSRPWSAPVPLLRGSERAPSWAFDTACGVKAVAPDAEDAVHALADACADPALHRSVRLRAGDLLAIDNNRAAHSRSSFEARFDGADRWLQRVYVRHAIAPLPVASAGSYRVLT